MSLPPLQLSSFIALLAGSDKPDHALIASEIEALQAIYGEEAVQLWHPPEDRTTRRHSPCSDTIRYTVTLSLPYDGTPDEPITLRVLVSLPPTYPSSSPPQLQLLSKYVGNFGADSALFGAILRTYISVNGVDWSSDTVCVFDGLQNVIERCTSWYEERLSADKASELLRMDAKEDKTVESNPSVSARPGTESGGQGDASSALGLAAGIEVFVADPIVDRKSVFVGRACRLSDPTQVPYIISMLRADKRIARAAHPTIWAYRCQAGSTLYQDHDDDGETAAGGRLGHLLQIVVRCDPALEASADQPVRLKELDDVLVIVTRYFGGIHLGPDRFKHINNAARNALEVGGFLDSDKSDPKRRGRKH